MSQQSRKILECNKCKNAGFPGQEFYFDGKDANGWVMRNPDGSLHQHKTKQDTPPASPVSPQTKNGDARQADIERMHKENLEANRQLVAAIHDLASAIRGMKV